MPVLTGSVGSAFSEDADFDELDDLAVAPGATASAGRSAPSFSSTGRQRLVAVLIALLVIAVGTRDLFFGTLPLVGQLAPLPSWSSAWHHFFSGWQSAGVGTTAPASPAFGLFGIVGTAFFGAMGTLQRVLLLGCIPLGALGVARFMRPLVSPRARVVAVIAYLGVPLAYGSLGAGRWDGLVAYAIFPFIALWLARAGGLEPFAVEPGAHWRSKPAGQVAILGLLIAAGASFAPGARSRGGAGGRGLGAGLVPRRRGRRRSAAPRGDARSGGGGARAVGAVGGRDLVGGQGRGGDLRAADRRRERARLG